MTEPIAMAVNLLQCMVFSSRGLSGSRAAGAERAVQGLDSLEPVAAPSLNRQCNRYARARRVPRPSESRSGDVVGSPWQKETPYKNASRNCRRARGREGRNAKRPPGIPDGRFE